MHRYIYIYVYIYIERERQRYITLYIHMLRRLHRVRPGVDGRGLRRNEVCRIEIRCIIYNKI